MLLLFLLNCLENNVLRNAVNVYYFNANVNIKDLTIWKYAMFKLFIFLLGYIWLTFY